MIKLDIQSIHNDDLGEKVGIFFDTPILVWDQMTSRLREVRDAIFRVLSAHSGDSLAPEVAELIATGQYAIDPDCVVRRKTASDRMFRAAQDIPTGSLAPQGRTKGTSHTAMQYREAPVNSRRITLEEATVLVKEGAQILWRPNNENYALEVL